MVIRDTSTQQVSARRVRHSKRASVCLLVAMTMLTACSSARPGSATSGGTSTTPGGVAYPQCPARYPRLAAAVGIAKALVPSGAVALVDCGYDYPRIPAEPAKMLNPDPLTGPRVTGRAVKGYEVLLDGQPPAASAQQACLRREISSGDTIHDVMLFGYRDGRVLAVAWDSECFANGGSLPGVALGAGGSSASLSSSVTATLASLLAVMYGPGAPLPPSGTRPSPSVVGLSIGAARAAARKEGFGVDVSGELLDASVPLNTVDVQSPPPGAPASTDEPLGLTVAVPPATACTANELRGAATPGEPGAGTAFATLMLRNISPTPCTLSGPLRVTPTDEHGRALAATDTILVPQPLVLSADSPDPSDLAEPDTLAASVLLSSTDYSGNCTGPVGHPQDWQVTLPDRSQLVIPAPSQSSSFPPVIICADQVSAGPVSFVGWQAP
jgi:Protein of unknown function (DUF4232)/PASTA domain